ncbi:MAG: cysteine hydrolase family protein [Nitrososphaerales archaeon]
MPIGKKELPMLKAEETCFLIVDMQNDFVSPAGYFGKVAGQNLTPVIESVPKVASFLNYCREKDIPRVHVKVVHPDYTSSKNWKDRFGELDSSPKVCLPYTWGAEIIAELKPKPDEPVVTKRRYDGFLDTDLAVVLRAMRTRNLLVAGTKTNVCVETTVRHAFCNDFLTVTLSDCTSTPDPGMHEVSLWNLGTYFGYACTSEEAKKILVFRDEPRIRNQKRVVNRS